MKLVAEVPQDKIENDLKYLVIESDENDSQGYFLFFHKSLESPSEGDLWFPDMEDAKHQATFNYGVNPNDWVVLDFK